MDSTNVVSSQWLCTQLTAKIWKIMRLSAIFLLATALHVSATGYTQKITLNEKNAPLEKVFRSIHRQTGYQFIYNNEVMSTVPPITISVKEASIDDVLRICFANSPLSYTIENNSIVIKQKPTPAVVGSPDQQLPPPIDISGRVTSSSGEPLIGASITVRSKPALGTKTDALGVFILKGLADDDAIIISYTGYTSQTIKIGSSTGQLHIVLQVEEKALNEVIINKGYYTEKQRNTVGNVTTITAKDIEKQPVQNPLLALQGRVPGLEVTQLTGMNGGGVSVRIQGRNSITQGLDPLIVIDGVPYSSQLVGSAETLYGQQGGSPLNFINPNDIETIDVLKDADATSLYGSRAANGAILITTKKGKAGKSKVSLNLQQGWGNVTRRVDMMNSQQYLSMRREALRNANQIASSNPSAAAPLVYAPDLTIWDTTRYTDWQDVLIGGTAKYTNLNANVSGGTQAVQYLVGATYNRMSTVYPGDFDDKKASVLFNINMGSPEQRLKVGLSCTYTFGQNHLPGSATSDMTATALRLEPVAPALYKPDGTLNWAPNASGTSTWTNPLAFLENTDFTNVTKNLVSNLKMNYRIVKGLEFAASLGYASLQAKIFAPSRIESYAPERRPTSERTVAYANRNMGRWIIEPQINYQRNWSKGNIQALIGTTIQKNDEEYLAIRASGFSSDQLMKTLLAAPTVAITSSFINTTRYNALFGRFNYSWDDKYIFNFTARRDGSNRFGDNYKFSNFWSAGGAWIFTDELWIQKHLSFLNFGKLRMSYGITGNDQILHFAYMSTYTILNPPILYQGGIGLTGNGIPNPDLRWELTRKWQSGIDLGFIKDRINIGITYARNRSSNQLVNYTLPIITGNSGMIVNWPALVQNSTIEFVLNTVNLKSMNFNWTTSANLSIPRNKLLDFPGIENTIYKNITNGVVVGQPLGVTLVQRYAGVDPASGRFLSYDQHGNPVSPILAPRNIFLNLNSQIYGGINNSFKYKGIQLDIFIQIARKKGPRDMYWNNGTSFWPGQFGVSSFPVGNQPITVLNHWQKPGDNAFAPMYFTSTRSTSVTGTDAFYSYDASFARLKNVSLSWQLPTNWVRNLKMQSVRFYAHAQNLATITNYTGMDPESGGAGMPPLRVITLGGQIEF